MRVERVVEFRLTEQRSRFFAVLFPAASIEDVEAMLKTQRSEHRKANHHCWAARFPDAGAAVEKAKDDGEVGHPGRVLLELLRARSLEGAILVSRVFGGVKLGVGGVSRAFRAAGEGAVAIYFGGDETMSEAPATPRRSVLFVAGTDSLALAKARTLPVDAVVFDLEDAVAPRAKAQARLEVMAALGAGGYAPRECAVRINELESAWGRDDLAAAATSGANAVVLPRVESAAEVCRAARLIEVAGASSSVSLWAMIETPRGVLHAEEIAGSNPRLACLVLGCSDLTTHLRARPTHERLALLTSGSLVVLAARAAGIGAIDGVYVDLGSEEGFEAECRQGREIGFDGKTLIYPSQISAANRVFAPSDGEADWAMRVVLASESAAARTLGGVVLDGRMIDNFHVGEARRVLALQDAIRRLERANTEGLFSA